MTLQEKLTASRKQTNAQILPRRVECLNCAHRLLAGAEFRPDGGFRRLTTGNLRRKETIDKQIYIYLKAINSRGRTTKNTSLKAA